MEITTRLVLILSFAALFSAGLGFFFQVSDYRVQTIKVENLQRCRKQCKSLDADAIINLINNECSCIMEND